MISNILIYMKYLMKSIQEKHSMETALIKVA